MEEIKEIKEIKEARWVRGYEGLYLITRLGRVYAVHRKIFLKAYINNEVLVVGLTKGGAKRHKSVHILMAQTFLPNPHCYQHVNHKDGDMYNNNLDNLEWLAKPAWYKPPPIKGFKVFVEITKDGIPKEFTSMRKASLFIGRKADLIGYLRKRYKSNVITAWSCTHNKPVMIKVVGT